MLAVMRRSEQAARQRGYRKAPNREPLGSVQQRRAHCRASAGVNRPGAAAACLGRCELPGAGFGAGAPGSVLAGAEMQQMRRRQLGKGLGLKVLR